MRKIILALLVFIVSFTNAQKKQPVDKYAEVITQDGLRQHLQIIASAEMEGRETATEGERKAAAYLISQFEKMGLKPAGSNGYRMPFPLYRDTGIVGKLAINNSNYSFKKDFGTYNSINHNEEIGFSEAVFAGYGITTDKYDDYSGIDVTGKLVIVFAGEPKKDSIYLTTGTTKPSGKGLYISKATQATKKGAAALLIITEQLPTVYFSNSFIGPVLDMYPPEHLVNTFFISEKTARDIFGEKFKDLRSHVGAATSKLNEPITCDIALSFHAKKEKVESINVAAILEGTDKKDEYVVITAHYDHIGKRGDIINFGADDDGSGTVGVLQIAAAFVKAKQEGKGPKRSIMFMLVSGEEKGLLGSYYYSEHPLLPLDKTSVNLNIDMIGRTDLVYLKDKDKDSSNYVYVIGNDKLSSDLLDISDRNNKQTKLKFDYRYNDLKDPNRFYYRSDHYNFARKGVPIIFYFDGVHADYHKPSDTIDKINFELFTRRTRLVFNTAWEIANMENMLKRDKPLN